VATDHNLNVLFQYLTCRSLVLREGQELAGNPRLADAYISHH